MTSRRDFIGAALGALALPARAQPVGTREYHVGILRPTGLPQREDRANLEGLLPQALARRGYVEGRNLTLTWQYANGHLERLPALARELVRARPDAIVAVTAGAVQAATAATSTLPIVLWGNLDPVLQGLVPSLARPGGNLTGVLIGADGTLAIKKLEMLKEAVPRAQRIGVLAPADANIMRVQLPELERVAPSLGVSLSVVDVRDDYARAFAALAAQRVDALFVAATTYFLADRRRIIEQTLRTRLPSIWEWREQVEDGGLMAYGTSLTARIDRVADYVDRVLKGARPAEMPIDQPTKFELVLSMKAARAIGLVVPPAFLLRVDEVLG